MIRRDLLPMLYTGSSKVNIDFPKVVEEYIKEDVPTGIGEIIEIVELSVKDVLDLESDATAYISTKSTYTSYGNRWNDLPKKEQSDDRKIYFYEFSDLSRKPLEFTKVSVFLKWAKEHDVEVSVYLEEKLRENKINYVSCFNKCKYISVRETYEELDRAINYTKYNNCYDYNYYGRNHYDDWD